MRIENRRGGKSLAPTARGEGLLEELVLRLKERLDVQGIVNPQCRPHRPGAPAILPIGLDAVLATPLRFYETS